MDTDSEDWKDDGSEWGFVVGGRFVAVPKLPLINGGYKNPPMDVPLPSGQIRRVIKRMSGDG